MLALSTALDELQRLLGVTDVWRCVNPLSCEYTFYSKVHNSYSRIDYLLLSNSITENVINSEIHTILISDHAPISVTFFPCFNVHKTKPWKFNNMHLWDKKFVAMINERISFFEMNMNSVVSIQTVWEAFKATCRGWCISYGSAKQRERSQRKNKLMSELNNLEMQHMRDPNDQKLKTMVLLTRTELQSIYTWRNLCCVIQIKEKHFETGDKVGRMLALRLKQNESNPSLTT